MANPRPLTDYVLKFLAYEIVIGIIGGIIFAVLPPKPAPMFVVAVIINILTVFALFAVIKEMFNDYNDSVKDAAEKQGGLDEFVRELDTEFKYSDSVEGSEQPDG